MTAILDTSIPAQSDKVLYYLRFKWRGIQRKYRGQYSWTAMHMKEAARLAIREINTELLARRKVDSQHSSTSHS